MVVAIENPRQIFLITIPPTNYHRLQEISTPLEFQRHDWKGDNNIAVQVPLVAGINQEKQNKGRAGPSLIDIAEINIRALKSPPGFCL